MKAHFLIRHTLVRAIAIAVTLAALAVNAAAQEHWIATWAASPQAARITLRFPSPPAAQTAPGTPAPPPRPLFPPTPPFEDQTIRMIVRASVGGDRVRVQLSNAFGATDLRIGAAHIALRDKDSSIVPGSDRPLMFSGQSSALIPAGAEILSDAVDLHVTPLAYLTVSVYVPGHVEEPTYHLSGLHTTYVSGPGDLTGAASIQATRTSQSWYFLSGIDVLAPAKTDVIVAFGDSITDGATSTPDTDSSWPSVLAQRLLADKKTEDKWAVINEGISGNRLLNGGMGVAALARYDRDVLDQPGVKWVIVLLGINDIGLGSLPGTAPEDNVTAEDLIAAHKQLIDRAHLRGIRVIGATLTPYVGATYASDEGEIKREALNNWIRTSGAYDAVIDFDKVVQDPHNPKQILPSFNITDHLHPNDAGYKAMGDSIDLAIFDTKSKIAPEK